MTDTDRELVARLRAVVFIDEVHSDNQLGHEAADRIEALVSDRDAWKARAEVAERERDKWKHEATFRM